MELNELELDLASERRLYEAGIRPSTAIGLLLLSRLEQAEQDRVNLTNRLDAMRRQRDGYRNQLRKTEQQVARVRELHWKRTDRDGFYADSGKPIFRNVCGHCNDDHADGGVVPYPCDTIIALDGDTRRLADQGLGDNLARTTKNGDT